MAAARAAKQSNGSKRDAKAIILGRIRKRVNAAVTDFRTICGDFSDPVSVKSALAGLAATVSAARTMLGDS